MFKEDMEKSREIAREEIGKAVDMKAIREMVKDEIDKAVKPLEEKIKKLETAKTPSKYASGGISSRN